MNSIISEKRKSILVKIKSLLLKTTENGCTEAEAISASEMVGKLLSEYDLTLNDIDFNQEEFVEIIISTKSKVATYIHNLIPAIATYTDTKSFFERKDVIHYHFFGSTKDVQIAEFLFHLLNNSVKLEIDSYKKTPLYKNSDINGKTKTTSFSTGMVNRLSSRLNEMKIKFNYEQNNVRGLVKLDKKSIVEREFSKKDIRLRKESRRSTVKSSESYFAGQMAGNKVNITSGIKSSVKCLD